MSPSTMSLGLVVLHPLTVSIAQTGMAGERDSLLEPEDDIFSDHRNMNIVFLLKSECPQLPLVAVRKHFVP